MNGFAGCKGLLKKMGIKDYRDRLVAVQFEAVRPKVRAVIRYVFRSSSACS